METLAVLCKPRNGMQSLAVECKHWQCGVNLALECKHWQWYVNLAIACKEWQCGVNLALTSKHCQPDELADVTNYVRMAAIGSVFQTWIINTLDNKSTQHCCERIVYSNPIHCLGP